MHMKSDPSIDSKMPDHPRLIVAVRLSSEDHLSITNRPQLGYLGSVRSIQLNKAYAYCLLILQFNGLGCLQNLTIVMPQLHRPQDQVEPDLRYLTVSLTLIMLKLSHLSSLWARFLGSFSKEDIWGGGGAPASRHGHVPPAPAPNSTQRSNPVPRCHEKVANR